MTRKLFMRTKPNLSLIDAIKAFDRPAVGIFYGPDRCFFGKVATDGVVAGAKGPLSLDGVYEARVFDEKAEMRWWSEPVSGEARVAVLSESPLAETWGKTHDLDVIDTIPQTYLLWGKRSGQAQTQGWVTLTAARVGKLDVPLEDGPRVCLLAVEYLMEYEDGNVAVGEERLTGIKAIEEKAP